MENNYQDNEAVIIDFLAFFKVLWNQKWVIVGLTAIFTFAGTWYALTSREEFVSEGKILPEVGGSGGGALGGLANLVGIGGFELGLKNNTDAIRPDLYPNVLNSTPFFLSLFEQSFINKEGDSLTFEKLYHQEVEGNEEIDKKLLSTFEGKPQGVLMLDRLTESRIADLRERITGDIDTKSGVITISVKMPDPVVAAQIASFAISYITNYVTNYRTEKAKQEVEFLEQKVAAAKGDFYQDQSKKASYEDRFSAPTIRLKLADIQRERLESEYRLSSTVYNELLKKLEESKIKLQQQIPVFQVLEPPVAPNLKSEPRRFLIIFGSLVLGFLFSIVVSLIGKNNFKKVFINELR